ncbi:MAG: polysaccharide lyase family 7 protein [Parcubacteria group bacterium]|jgi:hypothetical protein
MKRLRIFSLLVLALSGGVFLVAKSYASYKKDSLARINVTPEVAPAKDELPAVAAEAQPSSDPVLALPVESEEPASEKTAVNLADTPKINLANFPAQVLNLANWKQTLPTGASGKPREIKAPSLSTFADAQCFRVNDSADGVVFRAAVNGVTTSGSSYPRSELREMSANGTSQASWSTSSGTHSMFIDAAITAVPKTKKHVVLGQIHDASDDVIVIRLEYPKLFVDINGQEGPTLDSNYKLGKRFTVKFVAAGGKIQIYYNGSAAPSYTLSKKTSGCYFKAGAYTQSNCSKEKDCSSNNYGEVVIHKLDVQHS